LLGVAPERRDDGWRRRFYEVVATAQLTPGNPDRFVGPDGLPYASLHIPPIGQPSPIWTLTMLVEWCTDNGHGAVLHDRNGNTAWVFTYGNMWSLRSLGTLDASPPDDDQSSFRVHEDESVLVASPAEHILPSWARAVLRTHLVAAGIAEPRVALVMRPGRVPEHSFALTLPADRDVVRRLTWVVPPHLAILDIAAVGGGQPL
jgi:hypothetical protein